MGTLIKIADALQQPVSDYRDKRRYNTIKEAANELIRIGLETEEKRR
jgi:hypothetical protein